MRYPWLSHLKINFFPCDFTYEVIAHFRCRNNVDCWSDLNYKDCPCKTYFLLFICLNRTIYLSLYLLFYRVYIYFYTNVHIYIYNCLQPAEWTTIKHIHYTSHCLNACKRKKDGTCQHICYFLQAFVILDIDTPIGGEI